jgi:hypothetical protein
MTLIFLKKRWVLYVFCVMTSLVVLKMAAKIGKSSISEVIGRFGTVGNCLCSCHSNVPVTSIIVICIRLYENISKCFFFW